jgi:hypothetical protein
MSHQVLDRLRAIQRFLHLETNKDAELQEIVDLSAELLNCPLAIVTLIDGDLQHVLYKGGTDVKDNIKYNAFRQNIDHSGSLLIIPDTLKDPAHSGSITIGGTLDMRFYAGAELRSHDGHRIGNLCVLNTEPGDLSAAQQQLLKMLAKRVMEVIEFEYSINLLKDQFLQTREAESKLRYVFESSDAGHMLVSWEMIVLDFNKHMSAFMNLAYGVPLIEGKRIGHFIHGLAFDDFVINFRVALSGEDVRFQQEITYQHGEKVWWLISFLPFYNKDGDIACVSFNATNINEHKINKELVIAQHRSLRQIAFIQSHELRKPVATILGLMGVMRMEYQVLPYELLMMEEATKELDSKIKMVMDLIV